MLINDTDSGSLDEPPPEFWLALRSVILEYHKNGSLIMRSTSILSVTTAVEGLEDPLNIKSSPKPSVKNHSKGVSAD